MGHVTPLTDQQHTTARDSYQRGLSLRAIASLVGVSRMTVSRMAEREGWQRDPGEAQQRAEERRQQTEAAVQAQREKWADLRENEARSAGISAGLIRRAALRAAGIPGGQAATDERNWTAADPKSVNALASLYRTFIEGAEKMSDQATEHHVSMSYEAAVAEAARLDELAAQRAKRQKAG